MTKIEGRVGFYKKKYDFPQSGLVCKYLKAVSLQAISQILDDLQ